MATNYTTNYGLCQWEPEDNFLREEFNQDNAKIDEALTELEDSKADSSSVDSQFATVNKSISTLSARLEVVVGNYIGDGEVRKTISLGFTPKAVFLEAADGERGTGSSVYGGLALPGDTNDVPVGFVDGGFEVYHGTYSRSNVKDKAYHYLAFK